jgi:iron(III) transport system ATP-binding protein
MNGPVTNREFLGATVRYGVRIGGGEVLVDAPFQSGGELREVGEMVGISVPERRRLYLPA